MQKRIAELEKANQDLRAENRALNRDITKYKEIEKALQESEEKYHSLFNSMTEVFQVLELVYNENGQAVDFYYREVNPASEKLSGKSQDEMVGKRARELFGFVEEYWIQALNQVNKSGEPLHIENYSKELDKYYDLNAFKVADRANTVAIVFYDITDRKRAEEALTASEANYHAIVENAGEGIAISRIDGTMTFVNQRMADMLGYNVDEMLGRPGLDFVFPDWECYVHEATVEMNESGTLEGEFKLRRKDGSPLWTHYTAVRMFDERGEHVANMGLHTDITERKRAEEVLQEREQMHAFQSAILESVRDPLWATDSDFRIVYWNDAATATFGWTADDVQGRNTGELFRTLVPGSTRDEAVGKLMQTGNYHGEVMCHCKDGRSIFIETSSRVVRGPDGKVIRVINTARDITERKLAEEALKASEERFSKIFHNSPIPMTISLVHEDTG